MKINKYKVLLFLNITVCLICIYGGLTGNISWLQKYIIRKREYRVYMWNLVGSFSDLLLIFSIPEAYPKLEFKYVKVIVFSTLALIQVIAFFEMFTY